MSEEPDRPWNFMEVARSLEHGVPIFGQSPAELNRLKVAADRGLKYLLSTGEVMRTPEGKYQIVSRFWANLTYVENLLFGVRDSFELLMLLAKHGIEPSSALTPFVSIDAYLKQLTGTIERLEQSARRELVRLYRAQRKTWNALGRPTDGEYRREILRREPPGSPLVIGQPSTKKRDPAARRSTT